MNMDGQIKCKTDQQPPFARGGSILADGLMLMTDGNTKLYLVEPSPAGFTPLASAVILEQATTGRRWRSLKASCSCADRRRALTHLGFYAGWAKATKAMMAVTRTLGK